MLRSGEQNSPYTPTSYHTTKKILGKRIHGELISVPPNHGDPPYPEKSVCFNASTMVE